MAFFKQLQDTFDSAEACGHLIFGGKDAVHETYEETIDGSLYSFILTLLKTLQERPENGTIETNPFAKPEPELTVLEEYKEFLDYKVVLNKYPVVPYHFMLISKDFLSQDTPLSPIELSAIYSILLELKNSEHDREWFAFYNSGPQSGASQPHKHVQFMPLSPGFSNFASSLVLKEEYFVPSEKREPLQDKNLPFAHFVAPLPRDQELTPDLLAMTFIALLQRVLTVLRDEGQNHISYNVIATLDYMMIVPRSNAKYKDIVGINSCGYMGLVLCKNEKILNFVKEDGILNILGDLGFENRHGLPTDEYQY